MEPNQNPTSPQEPKKSFWQKLFGGGTPASSPVTPPEPASDTANSAAPSPDSVSQLPGDNLSAMPPASDWSTSAPASDANPAGGFSNAPANPPIDPSAMNPQGTPTEDSTLNNPVPVSPSAPAIPSWRDSSPGDSVANEAPVPPSDPMVTPVQPLEQPNEAQAYSEGPMPAQNPPAGQDPLVPQVPQQDGQADSDRPSITPPTR